ncbi:MAG: hypothetical protein OEL20_05135 [Sulfuritalea sp.]|nr:hypothetical protein [Sulfuritalea sp.]
MSETFTILCNGEPTPSDEARIIWLDRYAFSWDPEEARRVFDRALESDGEEARDILLDAGFELILPEQDEI